MQITLTMSRTELATIILCSIAFAAGLATLTYHRGYSHGKLDGITTCPEKTVGSIHQLNGDVWCIVVPHGTYGRATKRVQGTRKRG